MKKYLLAFAFILPALALAQVPLQIQYQGYLTNAAGAPLNAPTEITFLLYATQSAPKPLWAEIHPSVPVANGNFSVMLGSVEALPLSVFDTARWLGVRAAGDAEMAPRQALGSAPFAYVAERANQLSGSATVQGSQIAGNIAGAQVTGTISNATIAGSTLTGLDARYVPAVGNTITTLDAAGNVGEYLSLAIGADGLPVISYYQRPSGLAPGRLKVAKCGNPACTTGTISVVDPGGPIDPETGAGTPGAGQFTSIAIGADGLPVIAYLDAANQDLKVAKCANAACTGTSTITTLDFAGDVGWYTSIAVGADGLPVISYTGSPTVSLKVAKCSAADCTGTSTVTPMDPSEVLGAGTSIKIGSDGLAAISYQNVLAAPGVRGLRVAKCGQADCAENSTFTTVDPQLTVGLFSSITLDDLGRPVISYQGLGGLKVAKCLLADCTGVKGNPSNLVDSSGIGVQYTSIAIGQGGRPLVAYYDADNLDLRVAKCANADCLGTSQVTAVDSAGDVGQFASMAIGADGLPVIAYYDATNGDLKVVKCATQTCAVWQ